MVYISIGESAHFEFIWQEDGRRLTVVNPRVLISYSNGTAQKFWTGSAWSDTKTHLDLTGSTNDPARYCYSFTIPDETPPGSTIVGIGSADGQPEIVDEIEYTVSLSSSQMPGGYGEGV